MRIIAKFDGTCRTCNGLTPRGTEIEWSREGGARHATEGECKAYEAYKAKLGPSANLHQAINLGGVVEFLLRAKAHGLKYPKVRFLAPDGRSELRLSVAGEKSKYPGSVQVKIDGEWVGRVEVDGTVAGSIANAPALIAELKAIAADPAAKAAAYGALSGHCSFCGLQLTDEGSVEVGYGPICAAHYGLPHTPKGTKAVAVAL